MLSHLDTEYHRSIRREAQRQRRANQDSDSRDLRRKNDSDARRSARDSLQDEDRARIRVADSVAHSSARNTVTNASNGERWWTRVSMLNSNQNATPLGLQPYVGI
jgi:hypothetical protein